MKISIYCYPADEPWSPESTRTGIGGSEEAVINIARELAALGQRVEVFNSSNAPTRDYQGVVYKSYGCLGMSETNDVAIVWRYAGLYPRHLRELKIRKTYLWLHDAFPAGRISPFLPFFYKVMVLSKYHKSLYDELDSEKIFITSNGIDSNDFDQQVVRNWRKVVYGSSYDRGLRILLQHWKTIKSAVPSATLSIFYGWQSMQRRTTARYMFLRSYLGGLMRQSGVTHLGRIGHQEVAREYLSAGIWAYPCTFPEVSCISGMKAQAGGAIPVIIPTGALRETVNFGFKTNQCFTDFENGSLPPCVVEQWLEALLCYLRHPEKHEAVRLRMMGHSRRLFSWRRVALEWIKEFHSTS